MLGVAVFARKIKEKSEDQKDVITRPVPVSENTQTESRRLSA